MLGRIQVLLLALLLAACASTRNITVQTDFDAQARFADYHSYSWIAAPDGGTPLMPQRILAGIDTRLQAAGWKRVADGQVHVAAHVTTRDGQTYNTFYTGLGHDLTWMTGRYVPSSVVMSTDSYRAGTLVVDMFDAASRRAIWRGSASGVLPDDASQRDAAVDSALQRMFADFPPPAAAGR
ncbi:MAG TPA: DUF4136 domain-containing protein [Variovorax sp.]